MQQEVAFRPAVLLSIFDHFMRNSSQLAAESKGNEDDSSADSGMVLGTLLGTRGDDGRVVEVRSCFAVPHSETGDQCALDVDYHRTMMEMHGKLASQQQQQQQQQQQTHHQYISPASKGVVIVGWYATGQKLSRHAPALSDFYSKEAGAALGGGVNYPVVHLLVDPMSTGSGKLSIRLYQPSPIGGGSLESRYGLAFSPVDYHIMPIKQQQQSDEIISEMQSLESLLEQLGSMIDRLLVYVRQVLSGDCEPDEQLGRQLADLVLSAPSSLAISDPAEFERLFQGQLQDHLMTVYLSSLTKAQLAIAERLQVAATTTTTTTTTTIMTTNAKQQ